MEDMNSKILKEKSNRIFFLKAILLGIEYSESGKGIELKNTIKSELNKLQSDNHSTLNQNINITNNDLSKDNNIIQNGKITLQKYEQILQELNAQKLNISNKISNISSQSYMKTLSLQQSQQIQKELFSLKKMILVINKEIEKYSLLHQSVFKMTIQPKISPQENIMKKNNNKNYLNPSLNNQSISSDSDFSNQPFFYNNSINQSSSKSLNNSKTKSVSFFPPELNNDSYSNNNDNTINSEFDDSPSSNNYENHNIDLDDSNDLLKELQKTFGNLSSLLNSN